ncbi:hypothetical protein D3C79_944490 [compost metagenome]
MVRVVISILHDSPACPIAWRPFHIEASNHHVIGSIQKNHWPLIGGDGRREPVEEARNDLRLHSGSPVHPELKLPTVSNTEHSIDRINLGLDIVIKSSYPVITIIGERLVSLR